MVLGVLGAVQTVGPVSFDYTWFQTRYPELSEWCSPGQAQGYFDIACLYCDNTDAGIPSQTTWDLITLLGLIGYPAGGGGTVTDIPKRQILLGLLTAHVAALNAPLNGNPSPTTVGRISSATEGSVSVSFAYPEIAGAEWYGLTKYGIQFWQATKQYRMAQYFPGPGAAYNFRGGRGGYW